MGQIIRTRAATDDIPAVNLPGNAQQSPSTDGTLALQQRQTLHPLTHSSFVAPTVT